jgi:hypothetical protein
MAARSPVPVALGYLSTSELGMVLVRALALREARITSTGLRRLAFRGTLLWAAALLALGIRRLLGL